MHVVWGAWRSFVPHSQVKRQVVGRAHTHWRRHALVLCFAGWHDVTVVRAWQRQQLAEALVRWDSRRMFVALDGWRAVVACKASERHKLRQVSERADHAHAWALQCASELHDPRSHAALGACPGHRG
jgi:hypothetical protein